MNRAAQMMVLLAITSVGLAVSPAPADPAPRGKAAIAHARIETCREAIRLSLALYNQGTGSMDNVVGWSRRLLDSQRAGDLPKEELIAAIRKHTEFLTEIEDMANKRFQTGLCQRVDVFAATYARLEAEQWLAEAEGK